MDNSYQHDRNAEILYLEELIAKFGNNSNLQGEEAFLILYDRYQELQEQRNSTLKKLHQSPNEYYKFCLRIHSYLYKPLLSNAGQVRSINEPDNGNVSFGGTSSITMKDKFVGTEPNLIESELREAFTILFKNEYKPPEKAIRFYAEFVAIHPFYDANGRIGRYIVDIYLQHHFYYIDWESIDKKYGKFRKKLNSCHSMREAYKQCMEYCKLGSDYHFRKIEYWQSVREKYINYLREFWMQFVGAIDELEIE